MRAVLFVYFAVGLVTAAILFFLPGHHSKKRPLTFAALVVLWLPMLAVALVKVKKRLS